MYQTGFDAPVSGVLITPLHNLHKPSLELVTLFNITCEKGFATLNAFKVLGSVFY